MRDYRFFSLARFSNLVGSFFVRMLSTRLRRLLLRQTISIALIFSLLFLPGSSYAFAQAPALASALIRVSVLPVTPLLTILRRLFQSSAKTPETTADRSARVSTITILPGKIVGYLNQQISFCAVGRDSLGNTVQGTRFDWSSSDEKLLSIDDSGQATLIAPGLVWVTASTPLASGRAPVLVRPAVRGLQTDEEWKIDQDQLRPDGSITATGDGVPTTEDGRSGGIGALLGSLIDKLAPTAHAQTGGGDSGDFLYDELWSEPRNLVGSPRNRAMDSSAIGAVLPEGSNLEFSVPIISLPGRGLPLSVAMHYNSRIWSRHGSAVTFNAVNTWPYVGFTFSFGRIVTYGSPTALKYLLIEGDGTRRFLGTGGSASQTVTLQTNDGSHITYVGNASAGGTLYFNSGVRMSVTSVNNRLLVTQISERNGNFIVISYANQPLPSCNNGVGSQWKQAISSITDTLGRVISFSYDDCNNLVSVAGPGLGGTSATLAQFDYQIGTISNSFSGLTVENRPTGLVAQLKHVYYPETQTGYLFTYSAYGMIYNVSLRKQMSIDQNGVISNGTEKAYVNFTYPTTGSSLTDAPTFTTRTQYPAATSGGTATYS